ncbi:hypothetical protein IW140_001998 [Coemansia sp. RSA 1813]|nr:hypothetical protein EV178_000390 [Coemansia sp. RSA 1646]KAJ1773504.1 hypothetical protein LPJ74_000417 [Coemansia sp. RSA 1843]KAJ2085862.1 hypothetical protein IW138_006062 [Coemansia sp. RSA 986]KAJ2216401.1 hypothetical protein EV179_001429 [Coemansia sp. RSA 487]KAJ2570812.1 hypothetical protein IW140_001998 [Coemansia sp. RSA 1813]
MMSGNPQGAGGPGRGQPPNYGQSGSHGGAPGGPPQGYGGPAPGGRPQGYGGSSGGPPQGYGGPAPGGAPQGYGAGAPGGRAGGYGPSGSSGNHGQQNMRGNANSSRGFQWVTTKNNQIPPNAVQGGVEKDGKPLFVARAMYKGGLHPGKAGEHIQGGGCSIGFGHKEVNLNEYQVLCGSANNLKWVEQENSLVVQGFTPVEGGYEESGEPLFIAKTLYDGSQQLGKCGAHIKHGMSFAYGHKEKSVDKYMVLAYTN